MEELKTLPGGRHARMSEANQAWRFNPLAIPPRDLQEPVDRGAIRQEAREAGELWTVRSLHRRRDLWWDYFLAAETDAGRAAARCAIDALSEAIGGKAQRKVQSVSQQQIRVTPLCISSLIGNGDQPDVTNPSSSTQPWDSMTWRRVPLISIAAAGFRKTSSVVPPRPTSRTRMPSPLTCNPTETTSSADFASSDDAGAGANRSNSVWTAKASALLILLGIGVISGMILSDHRDRRRTGRQRR